MLRVCRARVGISIHPSKSNTMDASQTPSAPEQATPEKIRQLLATFVSPGKSADVGQKSPESTKGIQSRSRESFLRRVETFTPSSWAAKPNCLSPLRCAALGWECVARDVLRCCSCRTARCIALPPIWETAHYDEKLKEETESLKTSHAKYCTWPEDPCPDWLFSLPLHDPAQLLSSFCSRFQQLRAALPALDLAVLHDVEIAEDTMKLLLRASLSHKNDGGSASVERARDDGGDAAADGKNARGTEGSNGKNNDGEATAKETEANEAAAKETEANEAAAKETEANEAAAGAKDSDVGKVNGGGGPNGTGGHDAGAGGNDGAAEAASETPGAEGETNGDSGERERTPANVDADSEVTGKDGEAEGSDVRKAAAPGASGEVAEKADGGAEVDGGATVDAEPAAVAACVLALCGWDARPNAQSVVSCALCCRRVGLWNFAAREQDAEPEQSRAATSASPSASAAASPAPRQNLDSPPKQVSPGPRVAVGTKRSMAAEDASGGLAGDRDACAAPAKRDRTDADSVTFDPVSEHRHWCPWACPVTVPGQSEADEGAAEDTQPGWRAAVNAMLPMVAGEGTVSTLEPTDVWRKVHRSIMSWQVSGSG